MGTMIDRTHRELTAADLARIADTYHAWMGMAGDGEVGDSERRPYEDVPGFCYSATLDDIRVHNYVLTPGRYVGVEDLEEDGEPFEEKMERLVETLCHQQAISKELDRSIVVNLERLGYGE